MEKPGACRLAPWHLHEEEPGADVVSVGDDPDLSVFVQVWGGDH